MPHNSRRVRVKDRGLIAAAFAINLSSRNIFLFLSMPRVICRESSKGATREEGEGREARSGEFLDERRIHGREGLTDGGYGVRT